MMSSSRDPDGACARASEAGNAQARTRLMILQSMRHLLKNVAMSATEADAAPNCTSRRFTSAMAGTIDRNASIGVQRPTADIAAIEVIHETAGLFGVVECCHALPGNGTSDDHGVRHGACEIVLRRKARSRSGA